MILDLRMPLMDGWAFVQALQSRGAGRDVPILMLSGAPGLFDATATLPVRAVLSKPLNTQVLLYQVTRILAARQAR